MSEDSTIEITPEDEAALLRFTDTVLRNVQGMDAFIVVHGLLDAIHHVAESISAECCVDTATALEGMAKHLREVAAGETAHDGAQVSAPPVPPTTLH